jgi:hypothetical protein
MERLNVRQAGDRLEVILSHRLCLGAPRLTVAQMIDWGAPGDSANDIERSVDEALPPIDMRREIADVLRAHQAHLDYEAGREAVIAKIRDAAEDPTVDARTANRLLDAAEGR